MTSSRALAVAALLALMPLPATAQFGNMPGLPGGPGPGPGFGPPAAPPAACQELLKLRADVEKHGIALQNANKKKSPPDVACKLFKNYLAAEMKMIKGIEANLATCGIPPTVPAQLKGNYAKAKQVADRVCEIAARGPVPTGPSLSDALGTPIVPDASTTRTGPGTYDTLTGNPLGAR
jgi:hypothetical protein